MYALMGIITITMVTIITIKEGFFLLYLLGLIISIIVLASVVPICQFFFYKNTKETIVYKFSQELFSKHQNENLKDNFDELKEIEYSYELP